MSVLQSSSLNQDIHDSLFGDKNEILQRFRTETTPDWPIRTTVPSIQQPNLSWFFLEITPQQTVPLYLTTDTLNNGVMSKMNESNQSSLFRQNKKKEALNLLSQNLKKLWQPGMQDEARPFFWNPTVWGVLKVLKGQFVLEHGKEPISDILDTHSFFLEGLTKQHQVRKLTAPRFTISMNQNKEVALTLDRVVEHFFQRPRSLTAHSEKPKILTMKKNELDFQFLLVFLEYEFIFRNHREWNFKSMIEDELKKRKDMSPEMKSKVYLKFAKYLLSKEREKKSNIKKVLQRALNYQQDNYKINHYMGLVHYNDIQARVLAKEKKDAGFLKVVSDALKYFIKSIYHNTNLTRKFIIQGIHIY